MDSPRRDNRTWNGDEDYKEARHQPKRPMQSARERPSQRIRRSDRERPVQSSRERRVMSPHASPGVPKDRRRVESPAANPSRLRKHDRMRSPAPSLNKRGSGKGRSEPSTCRTEASSLTLSHLYADINNDRAPAKKKPVQPRKKERRQQEDPSPRRDSAFSIFSLASGPEDADVAKSRSNAAKKEAARKLGKSGANSSSQVSLEKKEQLDFSASSSSVTSFEVSAITHKYLQAQPKKAAMQHTELQPMLEEDSEEESTRTGRSLASARRRSAAPPSAPSKPRKHDNKIRGAYPSSRAMMPPFRQRRDSPKTSELPEYRPSSEILASRLKKKLADDRKPSQNSAGKSSRTSSISDEEELKKDQGSLSSSKCFSDDECFSDTEDEALAKLITASNRAGRELDAKARAKRADIAGIGPASKEKTKATVTYKLTKRDRDIMRQMAELEAQVLRYQKELPGLLEKYRASTKRAEQAKKELREAKARVLRYEKAHATVSRAIRTGRLYMEQKEYMAAILELMRATTIEKSNATLWYMLAECRLKISQPAAAEEACMTSLKLQPTGAGVALLGRILYERGRHDEAIECYLSALGRHEEADDE